jgi:hypothetical protein
MPNEQLESKTLTSFTGKLKAEKNGVRNRINQPVLTKDVETEKVT